MNLKGLIKGTICVLATILLFPQVSNAKIWTVCASGCDATTIQGGINLASAGDTVDVAAGTYTITGTINVNEEVTITGNTGSPANVIVQYSPADITKTIFEIQASNVTIEGIKTISGRYAVGFTAGNPTGCTISHCIFDQPGRRGINFWSGCGTGHTVKYTTISNVGPSADADPGNETGIMIYYPSGALNLTIQHNTFTNMYRGIWLYQGNSIVIDDNTFTSIKDQGHAGNVYNGAPAIDLHRSGATSTANRVEVTNNTVSDCYWQGIFVYIAPYTYVYNNTVYNCNYYGIDGTGDWDYAGIHVQESNDGTEHSDHCIIQGNTVYDCINGIQIWSDSCQVTNNEIYDMGLTYADEKIVGSRTYKNSAILIGSNFGVPANEHDPTGVVIQDNSIHDNYWGLFYSADLANGVTAEENWWGDASGPYHATTNASATGDAVSDYVDYSPWWGDNYVGDPHTTPWTWYVNTSNNSTIQEAVDIALAGDTINATTGTYVENLVINKAVMLQAASSPVIDGNNTGNCIEITSDGVTVDGYEVKNGWNGILGNDHDACILKNNTVHDNLNTGGYKGIGILFWGDADNNQILNNAIYNNDRQGIFIGYEDNTLISSGNVVSGNTSYNNGRYSVPSGPDSSAYGIQLWNADNNTITNNECYGHNVWWFGQGIYLIASNGNTVEQNILHDNSYGSVCWQNTTPSTFHWNSIYNNGQGMWNIDAIMIDAEYNWWGDASGPYHATTNPGATGDAVSDSVDYSPWWGADYVGDPHTTPWTWYVNTSNNSTIQEGIDIASAGDTVRVRPETYTENIVIDKALALLGAGQDSVLIYTDIHDLGVDSCSGPSFRGSQMAVIRAADIFISGFTFDGDNPSIAGNPDARNGIICDYYTSNPNNLVVRDCTVKNVFLRGIYGTGMGHITGVKFIHNTVDSVLGCQAGQAAAIMLYNATGDIDSTTVTNSHTGAFFHMYSDGNIRHNNFTDCDLGCGVNSNYALTTISHNTITRPGNWGAIQVVHQHGPVNIHNNIITDAPWGPLVYSGSAGNICDFQNNTIYGPTTKNPQPSTTRINSNFQNVPQDSREGRLVENPPAGAKYGDAGIYLSTESVYGDGPVHATITGNEVAGYVYNVVCHERAGDPSQLLDVNANGSAAPNLFYNYSTYAWYMEDCDDDIDAQYNYWGKSFQIEDVVFHQVDDPTLGLVDFSNPYRLGDANCDGRIDIADVVYLINYLFIDGPPPCIWILGNVNQEGEIDIADVVYLINYLFIGGPPPGGYLPKIGKVSSEEAKLSIPTSAFSVVK